MRKILILLIFTFLNACLFPRTIAKVKIATSYEFPLNYQMFVQTNVKQNEDEGFKFDETSMEVVGERISESTGNVVYQIQLFASASRTIAEKFLNDLKEKGFENVCIIYIPPLYRVRYGVFETKPLADSILKEVKQSGYQDAFVVEESRGKVADSECTK